MSDRLVWKHNHSLPHEHTANIPAESQGRSQYQYHRAQRETCATVVLLHHNYSISVEVTCQHLSNVKLSCMLIRCTLKYFVY